MNEITGNLWDFHTGSNFIVITTNGHVNSRGACVMGRGVALQAKQRFPGIEIELGNLIKRYNSRVCMFSDRRLIIFPVKYHWSQPAVPELISESARQLVKLVDGVYFPAKSHVYLPRPGCGNGGLDWATVKPLLADLDDRFTVVHLP